MNLNQLEELSGRVIAYIDGYRLQGALMPMHQLKLEHTLRVAADARLIAGRMGWSDEEVNLAEAVGWCHDVARFPQYQKYKTFSDADSVDHGDLGVQTLKNEAWLDPLDEDVRALILHSVEYHNKRDLPPSLTSHEEKYLRLVRDADRLDIFFVCADSLRNGSAEKHPELMMGIDFDAPPTPVVLDQFERGETIDYNNLASMADRFVLQLSWMHDLSYASTRQLVGEREILGQFVEVLPVKTERLLQCFESTARFLERA